MCSTSDTRTIAKKNSLLFNIIRLFAEIFNPVIPVIVGCGLINALYIILTEVIGLNGDSLILKILYYTSDIVYFFLPILLAISCSKVFKCDFFVSVIPVALLLFTEIFKIFENTTSYLSDIKYSNSVLPAIAVVAACALIEKMFKRLLKHDALAPFVTFFCITLSCIFAVLFLGPITVMLTSIVGSFVNSLIEFNKALTGALLGGGWTFLVTFGLHWGIVPIMVNNLAINGYDYIRTMMSPCIFSSLGVATAMLIVSKTTHLRSCALTALTTTAISGVNEQLIFGIYPYYKKPLIAQCLGGAAGGFYMGLEEVKSYRYAIPSIPTIPAFIGDTFLYFIIGISISFLVSFLVLLILKTE